MLRIEEPFHGAIVNHRYGVQSEDGIALTVTGQAPPYGSVTVNGVPAKVSSGRFRCEVEVTQPEQDITAVYNGSYGHQEHTVRVVWDRYSRPRYRFAIDDNIYCLRDVARNGYRSLFDCCYFAMLRNLHRQYGTKFALNIYYECEDGFQITEFPDRYRGEFEENADWLVLSFHAYANMPNRPYQYAAPEKLIADMDMVEEQIVRFAGERTLAPPAQIHWAMLLPEAIPELYRKGVRVLSGFFAPYSYGYDVHYWLDPVRSEYLYNHEALKDFDSGIVFSRMDMVCNTTPLEEVVPILEALHDNPLQAEIMDIITHEQLFWSFHPGYLADHAQRVEAAIRWATERGYEPTFLHEGFLGGPQWRM